jgi:hypothetical protein
MSLSSEKEVPSMSTKFTAMGRLPILSTLESPARADGRSEISGFVSRFVRPSRRLRHVPLELPAGLCLVCAALLLAFLI